MSDDKKKLKASQVDVVGIELKKAREAKQLSHTDLNRLTGISRSVLSGYETGRTKPGAKEIKLLCEALSVNPNRLLFGSDEPFKPRKGLRSLAKLRNSPAGIVMAIFLVPMVFSSLDDEQLEAILTLLASMVEARDKDSANKLTAFAEVFAEQIGEGTPEEMSAIASKVADKDFMDSFNKAVEDRWKSF